MKWFLNLFFLLFFSVQSFANDYIDVNFTNLKLDEFIKIVSKVSNKNILVSEPLDINLNFVSNKKIKKDDLITILKTILDEHNYILEQKGDFLKISKKIPPKKENSISKVYELRNIDAEITSVATHFLKSHKDTCVDGIITNRNGRCVVLVKASDKNTFGGFVYGDSQSGNTSYIEPPALISINNRKQELVSSEQEEIAKILKECSKAVSSVAEEEKANIETVAILDCIFAKASWGKDRDATAASLTRTEP